MEATDIQALWQQHEKRLDDSHNLNMALLREIKVDKAQNKLASLRYLPVSTLVFYLPLACYALYFAFMHREVWYFAFAGVIVGLAGIFFTLASIVQLYRLLTLDYNAPIVTLQKKVAQIKPAVLYNLRIAVWLLPFAPFVGVFVAQVLFGFDLTQYIGLGMIASFGAVTLILELLALWASKQLKAKNSTAAWVNWLLQGSGSQVDEALEFLEQLREFEQE